LPETDDRKDVFSESKVENGRVVLTDRKKTFRIKLPSKKEDLDVSDVITEHTYFNRKRHSSVKSERKLSSMNKLDLIMRYGRNQEG